MTHIVKIGFRPASADGVSVAMIAAQVLIALSNHKYHASLSTQRFLYVILFNFFPFNDGPQHCGPEAVSDAVPREVEVHICGYSLVTVVMTRRVVTSVEQAAGTHAPMG